MYGELIAFLKKLCILREIHKWNNEARRALREPLGYNVETALARLKVLEGLL